MKKWLLFIGMLVCGLSFFSVATAEQSTVPMIYTTHLPFLQREVVETPPPPPPSFAQQVVDLTNQHRANVGCPALTMSLQLTSASQKHTTDMSQNNFFSHIGSDGSTPSSRALSTGYFGSVGENIAAGMSTPQDVMNAWMNSPGHRVNILNCSYRSIGVTYIYEAGDTFGPYRHYWTQMFGTN